MQRFCLTLTMPPNEALIAEYVERHRTVWPEVLRSIRAAGVIGMEIFREENRLVMILEADDTFTLERKAAMDRANPVVMQWEAEMAKYQGGDPGADASGKWHSMERIFDLDADLRALRQQ